MTRALGVIIALVACCGCSTRVIPPSDVRDPVPIYLTDYGRHSSLLLPMEPLDQRIFAEYAFGDYDFFARERWRWWDMIRVAFYSQRSTIGRRYLQLAYDDPEKIAEVLGLPRVQRLEVSQMKVRALLDELDDRFCENLDTLIYGPTTEMWFVEDPRRYTIADNCNGQTARWLRELGCEIRGSALTSGFIVVEPAAESSRDSRSRRGAATRTAGSPRDTRCAPDRTPAPPESSACRRPAPGIPAGG